MIGILEGDCRNLGSLINKMNFSESQVRSKTGKIGKELIKKSGSIDNGAFKQISTSDLKILFELYDTEFFENQIAKLLADRKIPLGFRLSKRMTSAAGKTSAKLIRNPGKKNSPSIIEFELVISTNLLFSTFVNVKRRIEVNGIVCHNRLEALLRIFEHELIHLVEMLLFQTSSCSKNRFKWITGRLFAHRGVTHKLVTRREQARVTYNLNTGEQVKFKFKDLWLEGTINRISKRATVLVSDPEGERYSDGKSYKKFYVPLTMLQKV